MRGGLDDALDKLARRDELRRRAAGESPGTPPAVTELVEAIAGVVSRHPNLNVTVGVEGAGDPTLLHFAFADGVVQVSADHTVAARAAEAPPRHADFEIEVEEEEPAAPPRGSHDDQDRFGPTDFEFSEPPTAERPFVSPAAAYNQPGATEERPGADAARHAPHPFAAPPPPAVPPHTPHPYASAQQQHPYAPVSPSPVAPPYAEPPRHQAPPEPAAPSFPAQRAEPAAPAPPFVAQHPEPATSAPSFVAQHPEPAAPAPLFAAQHPEPAAPPFVAQHAEPQSGFPEPLAQPIPLQVERPEETEMAARRLAAMLRDDPTLLDNPPA
ncbi:hypothetical protein AB0F81_00115 [Actinoplanes sp. NPDC024001]|uniref:hypothetical protein n=1 Tax=Actinoplanes sp. NPDC024001 TaxID=3154598 RepID=UPI0033F6DFDA